MTQTLLNNRYRPIRGLSSGGFGETFLAEDTHMPSGRRCVIKQLKPITNNPQIYQLVQERFQREAAILEELGEGSNQIPKLYAYFSVNGQFYLVQEWIKGETLTNKLKQQGLLSESAVRDILMTLLLVLDYVHSKPMVHRDIKPDNIIVRQRDGKPVLIDFGAVKETMGTVVNAQGNNTSSIVIGTPGFMPSEQAAGRPVYSSDLYSLALTAIYLLTGKMPQALDIDPGTGNILWRRYALNVSPNLADVLDKAIESHPRDRYPTARAMLDALQSVSSPIPPTIPAQHPPIVSPPPTQKSAQTVPPIASTLDTGIGQKAIIIASLILGSLIGASVIVGLSLNRQPQLASEQITSPINPSSTQSPFSSPSQSSTISPVNSNQANNTSRNDISRPSPEQVVREQYSNINNRQYQAAWNKLSSSFQNNKTVFRDGYRSYVEWWETVSQVNLEEVTNVEVRNDTATVNIRLQYSKSGKVASESRRLLLVWDAASASWLIDNTKLIRD
ncbi:protein kinase [Microseira sp. BLCC-F43]|jgi:serine/threonine-protein kinase|uniref:protein kinase domain-containing protein n=1 Tax=Microseira sp. BLCC-F43 TaxID=3153602 RepID=UPI0035B7DB38